MAKKTVPAPAQAHSVAAGSAAETPGKSSKGGFIVGSLLVALLATGAGAGANIFLMPSPSPQAGTAAVAEPEKAQRSAQKMPDIVANLGDGKTWIRLESTVIFEDTLPPEREALAAIAASALLGFLKTLQTSDVEGAAGFLALREDLTQVAASATNGKITTVLITAMVLE